MAHEEEHHRITTRDLKEQLAKLPDDSRLAFMVDGTRGQFLSIAPSEIPGVEDVFVVHLHLLPNYPPLSR